MQPVLIGYLPKMTRRKSNVLDARGVEKTRVGGFGTETDSWDVLIRA